MAATQPRIPRVGDIVIYHDVVKQDLFDSSAHIDLPAIVTEVLGPLEGQNGYRVRLTAFRPFDKPSWDITAAFAPKPQGHHWTWRDE